jgi:hypothetical protein
MAVAVDSNPHLWQISAEQIYLKPLHALPRRLSSDSPRLPYRRRRGEIKSLVHWGQRKLLISEIEFLSKYAPSTPATCVYCGAAPGIHIPFLSHLFPLVNFILIDPAPFHCQPSERICIRSELMTDSLATEFRQSDHRVLFVSDIRSADWRVYGNQLLEQEIAGDMDKQMRWHDLMCPIASMLKFRLPWTPGSTEYLRGEIHLPLWGPQTTTEARLVVEGHERVRWDHQTHWEQMFYFNTVTRCSAYDHRLPIVCRVGELPVPTLPATALPTDEGNTSTKPAPAPGTVSCCLDYCYDCAGEVAVLKQYLERVSPQQSNPPGGGAEDEERVVILSLVDAMSEACCSSLPLRRQVPSEAEPRRKKAKWSTEADELTSTCPATSHTLDLLRACAPPSHSPPHLFWMEMAQPDMSDLPHSDRGERGLLGLGCDIPPDCALDIWLWRLLESLRGDSHEPVACPSPQPLAALDDLRLPSEEKLLLLQSLHSPLQTQTRPQQEDTDQQSPLPVVALFADNGVTYLFHTVPSDHRSATCSRVHLPPISWPSSLPGLAAASPLPATLPVLFAGRLLRLAADALWTLSLSHLLCYHGLRPPVPVSLSDPPVMEALLPVLHLSALPWRQAILALSGLREVTIDAAEKTLCS